MLPSSNIRIGGYFWAIFWVGKVNESNMLEDKFSFWYDLRKNVIYQAKFVTETLLRFEHTEWTNSVHLKLEHVLYTLKGKKNSVTQKRVALSLTLFLEFFNFSIWK